jgi:hypothetical protein
MAYPSPSDVNWSAGLQEGFIYVNDITTGVFMNVLILATYLVVLFAYGGVSKDWFGGMAVAGFVTFIVTLLLFLAGVVGWIVFGFVIAVAIISFTALVIDRRS